jgi:CoA:oxalate CoA-transferase
MVAHKIPCSIVNNLDQVNTDPQLEARDMHSEVEHARYGRIPTPGIPIKLSDTPGELHFAAPDLGQHNAEIYRDMLGMTAAEIDDLKKNNII